MTGSSIDEDEQLNAAKAFGGLVLDGDLNKLESLTTGFNIFESIGAVRMEMRHSDFLSFLLNPSESHGLYDKFLKAFLFGVTKNRGSYSSVSPVDVDLFNLSDLEIRREWENIDILLVSENEKFVCAIENKVDSSEHSDQLARYESTLNSSFDSNYKHLLIYLTIEGDPPIDDQQWLAYSYQDIHELIAIILENAEGDIGQDIFILLKHYIEMIERHFMDDNQIAKLSKKLYQQHKKALDIIFEHRPDALAETNACIKNYLEIQHNENIEFDHCVKGYVRFAVPRWDLVQGQLSGNNQWTKSNRVLLFQVQNYSTDITLKMFIGPGDSKFRKILFEGTSSENKIFRDRSKTLNKKWNQIYKKQLVTKTQMDYELDSIKNLITQGLEKFLYDGEFDKISSYIDELLDI